MNLLFYTYNARSGWSGETLWLPRLQGPASPPTFRLTPLIRIALPVPVSRIHLPMRLCLLPLRAPSLEEAAQRHKLHRPPATRAQSHGGYPGGQNAPAHCRRTAGALPARDCAPVCVHILPASSLPSALSQSPECLRFAGVCPINWRSSTPALISPATQRRHAKDVG